MVELNEILGEEEVLSAMDENKEIDKINDKIKSLKARMNNIEWSLYDIANYDNLFKKIDRLEAEVKELKTKVKDTDSSLIDQFMNM